jgi:hypothetical protein
MELFSIEEAIQYGWKTFKTRPWFFIIVGLLSGGFNPSFRYGGEHGGEMPYIPPVLIAGAVILGILLAVVGLILKIGGMKIFLRSHDGEQPRFREIFKYWSQWRLVFNFFLCSLLLGLIVLGGLVLLIIPGIIFAIRLQFALYLVVDKELGPIDAVKKSWEITRGHSLQLFLFDILCVFIILLGLLALIVGVFVAVPVVYLAAIFVYRKLFNAVPPPQALLPLTTPPPAAA